MDTRIRIRTKTSWIHNTGKDELKYGADLWRDLTASFTKQTAARLAASILSLNTGQEVRGYQTRGLIIHRIFCWGSAGFWLRIDFMRIRIQHFS
jgi:hypothetical protein